MDVFGITLAVSAHGIPMGVYATGRHDPYRPTSSAGNRPSAVSRCPAASPRCSGTPASVVRSRALDFVHVPLPGPKPNGPRGPRRPQRRCRPPGSACPMTTSSPGGSQHARDREAGSRTTPGGPVGAGAGTAVRHLRRRQGARACWRPGVRVPSAEGWRPSSSSSCAAEA